MIKITLASLKEIETVFQFLNPLENLLAWVKDCEGKFVSANKLFSERLVLTNSCKLTDLTDHDLAPSHLANRYIKDDQHVLQGSTITDRLELIVSNNGSASWFRTSKHPIYNYAGNIIGIYGFSKQLSSPLSQAKPIRELSMPIEYIQQNYSEKISIEKLAEACHLSVSTLERRFKKHMAQTPLQYIMEIRLNNARVLITESEKSMATIAQETGFVDNSHFTRAYKKRFHISPSEDRKPKISP